MNLNTNMTQENNNTKRTTLEGKTMYVPGMDYAASKLVCSVLRSKGINAIANVTPDGKTLELGSKYTSGEECLPEKVTIGDFMKVVLSPDFDAENTAFFMPISNGPCRFGQYAPYFKLILKKNGFGNVNVVSPSGEDGYDSLVEGSTTSLVRKAWTALVAADIVRKMLHKVRPYENMSGTTDKVFERAVERIEYILSQRDYTAPKAHHSVVKALKDIKREFMHVPANYSKERPLVGVVGEIFCRLNEFSNNDLIRHVEELGGECWLSDMCEWVWYTNYEEKKNLCYAGKKYSTAMLIAKIKHFIQHGDEKRLYNVFKNEFYGSEEPQHAVDDLFELASPYFHRDTVIGEAILSVGKSLYVYEKGGDGIIDISPFSCMNGIVSEAVYPVISKDHEDFPIKSLYFDGSSSASIDRDLPIFMEMSRGYMKRKTKTRTYPWYFNVN